MFSMLPNELEERIHKLTWESVYHENIIQQLEFHLIKMNKHITFLCKHVLTFAPEYYNRQILPYIVEVNTYLQMISKNKGLVLFLSGHIDEVNIHYVCNGQFAISFYDVVDSNMQYAMKCCILLAPTRMSRLIREKFIQLTKLHSTMKLKQDMRRIK